MTIPIKQLVLGIF